MKRILDKHNHYKSILHVLDKHKEVVEAIPDLNKRVITLKQHVERIAQILHELSIPVSVIYAKKKHAELNMIHAVKEYASLGILVASHKKDNVIMAIMKLALSQLRKVSGFRMLHNALQVADVLDANKALLLDYGVNVSRLEAFRKQINQFGSESESLKIQLNRRKSMRRELASLIADTNSMLHELFDPIAEFTSLKHPEFFREYKLIRKPKPRKKRTVKKKEPATTEVSLPTVRPSTIVKPAVSEAGTQKKSVSVEDKNEILPESFIDELKILAEKGIVISDSEHPESN